MTTRRQAVQPPRTVPARPSYEAQARTADQLRRAGRYDEAIAAFHALTVQHPTRADAFSNLGGMLQAAGHPMPALQAIARSLELDPGSVAALINSAEILKDFGEWQTVLDTYDAALTLQPTSAAVRFARALHLLTMGRWQEAWREHETRWQVPDMPLSTAVFTTPQWDGSPLAGRHILLDHEQGLGDQIMCARFAAQVTARGGVVTMRCAAPLATLFTGMPGVQAVITDADPIPPHDVHASLLSLPWLLGIRSPTALSGAPYLKPVGECPPAIRALTTAAAPRVGFVWSGNPQHRNDARRSIAPALLAPLVQRDGITAISLQRHETPAGTLPDVLRAHLIDAGGMLRSMNDTAHALSTLDCLITVDTSVAHLAGAMGVPTLLLVPFVPDWRWMTGRSDTPWYDSITLLRQTTLFDWRPVIGAAQARLDQLTRATP
jgi:Tfp pilus assembly protein PilF